MTLGEFFNKVGPRSTPITRASERRKLTSGWSKAIIESLGPTGAGVVMEAVLVTIAPNGSSGKVPAPRDREEFLFVLEGSVALTLGDEEFLLNHGDSALVRALQPRKLQNSGSVAARVLVISAASPA